MSDLFTRVKMGREEAPAQAMGALSERHHEVLAKRGIRPETALAAGLRSISAREAKDILGFDPKSGGILFPYFHPLTGEIRSHRLRPDAPLVIDGKEAKYLSPKGLGNLLYFPPSAGNRLQNPAEPLYVTEGEFKALAAWQANLFCVGTIGVWGWRGKGLDGQSRAIPDLDLIPVRGRVITITFDSDVSINPQVQRARYALGKEFHRREAASVYGVDLPTANGIKLGLDDFLVAYGLDAFLDLEIHELPPTDLPPFLDPISALLQDPDEPLEWGIEGILPLGASGWRIAGPKVGKSWDMLEEAYCLATAQPLYGHFRVPHRRRVVVIEEEDPRRRIKRRLHRIIHAHGGIQPEDMYLRCSVKKGLRLDDPAWLEVLEWEIKSFGPEFVYLDVFTRLHAKNINDAKEMGEIVLFLDRLSRDYGCAFIILHHTRKMNAGQDEHDEIIGSRILGGFAEGTLFFSRTKEKGVLRVRVALKDEPEDGAFEPEFLIRLKDTEDGRGTHFEYLGPPSETVALQKIRQGIKAFVLGSDQPVTVTQVAKAIGCSKPTAREHLYALADLGEIERIKGKAYRFGKPERAEK